MLTNLLDIIATDERKYNFQNMNLNYLLADFFLSCEYMGKPCEVAFRITLKPQSLGQWLAQRSDFSNSTQSEV